MILMKTSQRKKYTIWCDRLDALLQHLTEQLRFEMKKK